MIELLAPAGNMQKLKAAINFGADAVYFAGKNYGLRAFAGNFNDNEIKEACDYAHSFNKKVYITLNILARDKDFENLKEYLDFLVECKVDGVIVSDLGLIYYIHENAPKLNIHVSTQANVLNSYTIKFLENLSVIRIVLARELSLEEIKELRSKINPKIELEAFVHGAMCISYSGRCLLSNYLCNRDSNRGECVQACRWEYTITEKSRKGREYEIQEDDRGTYILNSKDLNMIKHIKELEEAGITSLKIEGRMKSEYYVANVVNAYRRAIDNKNLTNEELEILNKELEKTSHRKYTTGFYFNSTDKECLESSMPVQTHEFMAIVIEDTNNDLTLIEQRNRFVVGDTLEILSPKENFNKNFILEKMYNEKMEEITDAKNVQQKLYIKCPFKLYKGDILRKEVK